MTRWHALSPNLRRRIQESSWTATQCPASDSLAWCMHGLRKQQRHALSTCPGNTACHSASTRKSWKPARTELFAPKHSCSAPHSLTTRRRSGWSPISSMPAGWAHGNASSAMPSHSGKGAHLAVLKAFDAKVLELCTQTWQPGHGLRNVTARDSRENLTSWHRRNNHASSTCRHLQIGRWALETGSCCPSSTTPGCTRAAWASPRVVEPWIPGRPDAYWALRRWGHDAQTAPSGKITSQASDFPHPSGHPRLSLLGLQTVWPCNE